MYLDAFTLSAFVDECLDTLVGGRIQAVLAVDDSGIGLEIYADHRRHYLYLSADPQQPRLHRVADKLRRGLPKPTSLGLLLRRYIEGGVISHVSQPAWERIIQFDITGVEGDVNLYIEPMERRSNLLLVQNGIILDCMRRVGPEENRYRLSLPNHEYKLPPPQTDKHDPLALSLEGLASLFSDTSDPKRKTAQVLTTHLLGMSPLLAKEIVYRSGAEVNQKATDAQPERLFAAIQAVVIPLSKRHWQPGLAESDGRPTAFSVYPLQHLPGWHETESLSDALAAYYGAPVGEEAYAAAKIPVREALNEALARLGAKLASLERSILDESEREVLKQCGELILAYQYTFQPGQTELVAQYDFDKPALHVKLDPTLTPLENAQAYFARYDKAKRALDDVPRLHRETRYEYAYMLQLGADLDFAANWPEIDEVQGILQARGLWGNQPAKRIAHSGQSAPLKIVTPDSFVIWVGRNSRQNEQVTFGKGGGQDYWLHAHDVPGAHVVVKFDGRKVPESVLMRAAELAAYYSGKRGDSSVTVDITRCSQVRKIKGVATGMVTYKSQETRTVTPKAD